MNTMISATPADIPASNEPWIIETLRALGLVFHANSREKGFWDQDRNDGECIALMHSELSELLEGIRHGNPPSDHIPEFCAAEEELADVIIRVLEYGAGRTYRVAEAVIAKHKFNRGRARKHGGKAF